MIKKPHVLFIGEKWCDSNPEHGLSSKEENLYAPLEMSGLATQDKFYMDEYLALYREQCGPAVIIRCIATNPDLVIVSPPFRPELRYLWRIKKELKIPMIGWCGDSAHPIVRGWIEDILPFIEFCVVIDKVDAFSPTTDHPEKFFPIWSPRDERIYCDPGLTRDIGISFVGSIGNFSDRVNGIKALRENGIDIFHAGGAREDRLSVEEYASIYKRSGIALNFCDNIFGIAQCKGRVFETTLCGAMLLEAKNAETAAWFKPMVDYVPFKDDADLVEKAKYYLEHDSARLEIAARGHQKATEKYTGVLYWKAVLEKVFGKKGD